MKTGKLALYAIALWVVTIAAFGWFFVRGNTVAGTDTRMAVVLARDEREFVLAEMRDFLAGLQVVLDGLNRNDLKQVASAARAMGMGTAVDVNPALMAKLPLPFKQLGMSVHHDMDELAQAAERQEPVPQLQGRVTQTLAKCVACHATWQLKAQ